MNDTFLLYGGSFNPIHHGHLIAARSAAELLAATRIIFIPCANPPHKSDDDLAPAADRLEMVRLAIAGQAGWEASDCELRRDGPSYTFETVQAFRKTLGPQAVLCWMIGADSLPELASWYRIGELVEICRIVTVARPGWDHPDPGPLCTRLNPAQIQRLLADVLNTPRIDISATDIRRRVRQGLSIRYLVPDAVADYIRSRGLYRD